VDFELENGGYGYTANSEILVSERVLTLSNVIYQATNITANVYFDVFETFSQPLANVVYISANGVQANLTGNVAVNTTSTNVTGTATLFTTELEVGDYLSVFVNTTVMDTRQIESITNNTLLTVNGAFSHANTDTDHAKFITMEVGGNVHVYYANNLLAGSGRILELTEANIYAGEAFVALTYANVDQLSVFNANLSGNVVLVQNSVNIVGRVFNANVTGNAFIRSHRLDIFGDGTRWDKEFQAPIANIAGSVTVNTTSTAVIGSGSFDFTNFVVGQYLAVYSNTTNWHARQINAITNSTHLTVTSVWPFANATGANAALSYPHDYITAHKNTTVYEIRRINSIANATYMTIGEKFTFTEANAVHGNTVNTATKYLIFNANQTGTVAFTAGNNTVTGTGTTFSPEFDAGDFIAAWNNSTAYEMRVINSVESATSLTLVNGFSFTGSGNTFANVQPNTEIIFGTRVALHTNSTSYVVRQVNTVVNATALTLQSRMATNHSNSIARLGNVTTTARLYYETNTINMNVSTYEDKTATGNVMAIGANMIFNVIDVSGSFEEDEEIYQKDNLNFEIGNSSLISYVTTVGSNGILRIQNSAGLFKAGLTVYGRSSGATANVLTVTFNIGVIDVENTFTTLDGNFFVGNTLGSNGAVSVVSEGSGASFEISPDLIYPEYIDTCNVFIRDFINVDLDAYAYGFDGNTSANLTNGTIFDALDFANTEFGKIYAITGINQGSDYTVAPFVKVFEPKSFIYKEKDTILRILTNPDSFTNGEVITQSASGARGLLVDSNNTHMFLERLRILDINEFVLTTNSTTRIVGTDSGAIANVDQVDVNYRTQYIGFNALVDAEVLTEEGAITALSVLNSGFGFANGETVNVASGSKTGTAVAVLEHQGFGNGFYREKGGFLSDQKKLYDGYYYQDFSYEVQSKLTLDRYRDMLKQVLHVAGTKYFGALVHKVLANTNLDIEEAEITIE